VAELPNKLSALLRLAVQDAQKCEAMPAEYELRMSYWHTPRSGGPCQVCMAGAVMAQSLGFERDRLINQGPLRFENGAALMAIDDLRTGNVHEAARRIGVGLTDEQQDACERVEQAIRDAYEADGFDGCDYDPSSDDPEDFYGRAPWPVYLEAADILEAAGL
jgi:hypothetical protein